MRQVIYNGAMGVEFTILLGKSISLNDDTFWQYMFGCPRLYENSDSINNVVYISSHIGY